MNEQNTEAEPPARRDSGPLAAFLSFIWPGLWQAYGGLRRRALLHGVPVALVFVALIVAVFVVGPVVSAIHMLNPVVSLGAVVLLAVLGLWRAYSIIDAARPRTLRTNVVATTLVALVVVSHAWLGGVALSAHNDRAGERDSAAKGDEDVAQQPLPRTRDCYGARLEVSCLGQASPSSAFWTRIQERYSD